MRNGCARCAQAWLAGRPGLRGCDAAAGSKAAPRTERLADASQVVKWAPGAADGGFHRQKGRFDDYKLLHIRRFLCSVMTYSPYIATRTGTRKCTTSLKD